MTMRMVLMSVMLGLLGVTRLSVAFEPKPYQATYVVYWKGMQAGINSQYLKKTGPHRYYFESSTEPSLPIIPVSDFEKTTFEWINDTPKPFYYAANKSEFSKETDTTIEFNWKKSQARFHINEEWDTLPIAINTQDKVTYLFKLQSDLAQSVQQLDYWIAGDNKMRHYFFKIAGKEKIEVPFGTFETIKVIQEIKEKQRLTILWFAPKLNYQLVKVSQFRRGSPFIEAELETLE